MSDLISRQGVLDALCDSCDNVQSVCAHYPCKQYIAVEKLPSAQKIGKWEEGWTLKPGEMIVYDGDGVHHAWKKIKKVSTFCEPWKGADDDE